MRHVDALSRAPVELAERELEDARVLNINVHEGEILIYQHKDENLKRKIEILRKPDNERSRREKGEVFGFVLRNGILYKVDDDSGIERYVVPAAMRKAVVLKNHDFSGHFGVDRTVAKIRSFYYFPRMRSYIRRHIAACIECLFAKNKVGRQAGELHPIKPGDRPFEIVHLDHLGPFVSSSQKNKYILAAICTMTKFCQLYAVRNVKASTTVRQIEKLIERFGAPKSFFETTDYATKAPDDTRAACDVIVIKGTISRHMKSIFLLNPLWKGTLLQPQNHPQSHQVMLQSLVPESYREMALINSLDICVAARHFLKETRTATPKYRVTATALVCKFY
ncbi:unnamed protein product [Trichogramma brassicae]|uniref:RNA-directed DNA polymerase n=1 Tax=Trichogramma brassicae TaxID=86971 RepID=A0A6H5INI4_9HYME|nr:unnamed protein product [Trichogramma brassicae]